MPSDSQTPPMAEYDAVIVGAGPNGLAAAVALQEKGWRTLVFEAADTIGGGTRTKELTLPGFLHDVCSAIHPTGIASPFFKALRLEEHGLRWLHPDIPLAHPLQNGRATVLRRSVDKTADSLGIDAAAYRLLFEHIVHNADALFPTVFTLGVKSLLDPRTILRRQCLLPRFGIPAGMPAALLARACFRTDAARALFAGNAAHSVLPLEHLTTSAIAMMLQTAAHAVGWPVAEGGSQRIADALASKLRSLGGDVRCGVTVRSLKDIPPARAILFDTSPRVMASIAGDELPPGYRTRIQRFKHGPGVCKVDYALSGPVQWSNEDCRSAGTVHVGGTLDEIRASELDAFEGRISQRPFVLVAQQSLCDPTRAPAGKHTLWAYCHAPAGCSVSMEPQITAQIERFAPGFRDLILATHTMTATDMHAYNMNYIGGDIVGGMASWDQILTRPIASLCPYATPNPRIFLCSASTPPAGGVHGMCGWNAAQAVLRRSVPR